MSPPTGCGEPGCQEMIVNRMIDNAAVASPRSAAARWFPRGASERAPTQAGATVFGLPQTGQGSPEWAAWANGVAVRELDFHDTYLAADYSHPGDNIPPILAVGEHWANGRGLVRGIATGYEIQVDL